jgi:ribosomal protein S18 acetylase RimI-like enzyme
VNKLAKRRVAPIAKLPLLVLKRWQNLSLADQAAVHQISISAQQLEYAGTIDRAIVHCQADSQDDVAGLAIEDQAQIVGFLLLKRRLKAPDWARPTDAAITAMRIDQARQGQGLGAAALLALPHWVAQNWPEVRSLTLSVDEDNMAAISAYTKAGFQDHGVRQQGRIGGERLMSKALQAQQL